MNENSAFEMFDYIISLREGIVDAWSGAILSMKQTKRESKIHHCPGMQCADRDVAQLLTPYIESIFAVLNVIARDPNRSEALLRSAMGVIGFVHPTFYDIEKRHTEHLIET